MRLIGEFNNIEKAELFADYLTHLYIQNKIEEDDGTYEIWVYKEDQIIDSIKHYNEFVSNPDDIKYKKAQKTADQIKKQIAKEVKKQPKHVDVRTKFFHKSLSSSGKLTLSLIIISVLASLIFHFISKPHIFSSLFIVKISPDGRYYTNLLEIRAGQIWRLITPVFIHFSFIHILFNMMWLHNLGSMIEDNKGTIFLTVFFIITASISNLTEYFVSGPLFGGMSGVVYGLLGYIWMKSKFDPYSQLHLDKSIVIMMIVWYFLCFTGLFGTIANGAHTAGLITGIAWGFLSSLKYIKK